MATRSNIGILHADGSGEMVYCHWDGYPSHNGAKLLERYQDVSKIRELINLGSLSTLGAEIGKKHDFDTHGKDMQSEKWCLFYGRDRGEDQVSAIKFKNVNEVLGKSVMEEYLYLYSEAEGIWYYSDHGSPLAKLTPTVCVD